MAQYLDLSNVIRSIPMGFDATELIGKIFTVTGTGKYFKNVEHDPDTNLGIIRIAKAVPQLGLSGRRKITSEFPTHLMSHMVRLKKILIIESLCTLIRLIPWR